jgi:hypothetical protein
MRERLALVGAPLRFSRRGRTTIIARALHAGNTTTGRASDMAEKIRILLADDQVLRSGLKALLNMEPDLM